MGAVRSSRSAAFNCPSMGGAETEEVMLVGDAPFPKPKRAANAATSTYSPHGAPDYEVDMTGGFTQKQRVE